MAERRPSNKPDTARGDPYDRGLPGSTDTERFVLGSILLDGSLYVQAAGVLQATDFTLEKHRKIFSRMGDLQECGQVIDRVTLYEELLRHNELDSVDGLSYLVYLDDGLPQVPHLDAYLKILKEKSTLRNTIFAAQGLINRCLLEEPSKELHTSAEEILMGLGSEERDGGPQTPDEILRDLPGGIDEFLGPQKQGIHTGFQKLDEMTGGFHAGELTILAARPGVGKSAMAAGFAEFATVKLGKTAMLFSLEMSKESLLRRLMCSMARVDSQRVRLNYLNSDERRRMRGAIEILLDSKLYIDDKSAATLADLHARIRRRMARGPVDMVIVDYLQLMSAGRKFENRNQEVTYLTRGLKLLAKEINAPIIALSQLSRAPESRKGNNAPQLSDLRESGSIEQDADVVLFIFREEMYRKDREDLRGLADLIVGKQRSGPTGTVRLVFLHHQVRFENRAEDVGEPAPLLNTSRGKQNAAADYPD